MKEKPEGGNLKPETNLSPIRVFPGCFLSLFRFQLARIAAQSAAGGFSSLILLLQVSGLILHPSSALALDPQSCTITNFRNEAADAFISDTFYSQGQAFILTNCVAYSGGDTSAAVQDLTNITVSIQVGVVASNSSFTGTVQNTTNGLWSIRFNLATNWEVPYLWVKLTDTNTNVFIYPRKKIRTTESP